MENKLKILKAENKWKMLRGEITVYLSLTLILVLAFLCSIIEVSRIHVSQVISESAFLSAMDSTLAEYSSPLFGDYHLLLYDMGEKSDNENRMIEKIKNYMDYTFYPNQDLRVLNTSINIPNANLYNIRTKSLKITNKTFITDYNGELFVNEATEYMKYKLSDKSLQSLLEKMSVLKSQQTAFAFIEEKIDLEENVSELDKDIIQLMKLIDGLSINSNGFTVDSTSSIKIEDAFAKKICIEEITKKTVGVNQDEIFNLLKSKYNNPINYLNEIMKLTSVIKVGKARLSKLEDEIISLKHSEIKFLKKQKETNYKTKTDGQIEMDTNYASKKIIRINNNSKLNNDDLIQIQETIELTKQKIEKEKVIILDSIKAIKQAIKDYNDLLDATLSTIELSLNILNHYKDKKTSFLQNMNEYEKTLDDKKDTIEGNFYNEMKNEVASLKKYVGDNSVRGDKKNYNLNSLQLNLEHNREILKNSGIRQNLEVTEEESTLRQLDGRIQDILVSLSGYRIRDLKFDYSSFSIEKVAKNPIKNYQNLIRNGILELIIDDTSTISKKEINQTNLPSSLLESSDKDQFVDKEGMDIFSNQEYKNKRIDKNGIKADNIENENNIENKNDLDNVNNIENSAQNENSIYKFSSSFTDSIGDFGNILNKNNNSKDIVKAFLFHSYLFDHFKNQLTDQKEWKNTVLDYEQEYILNGNNRDEANLKSTIYQILTIRTLLNCSYLLCNQEANKTAYSTALALVGFTGLTGLISLTKTIILMIWSYEEALIDTSAILKEKQVPFIKNKDNFLLGYKDLFHVNKQFIKAKVKKLKTCEDNGKDFSYRDYVDLLYFLRENPVKSYRAMDLIQNNTNLRNTTDFSMAHCMFGFKINAKFCIPYKFSTLPFVQIFSNMKRNEYEYTMERAYSY